MVEYNKYIKIIEATFSKNIGNFGPIVAQPYARLYLRIHTKDFFQTLKYVRLQKITKMKLAKNFLFRPNVQFWLNCGPKLRIPLLDTRLF